VVTRRCRGDAQASGSPRERDWSAYWRYHLTHQRSGTRSPYAAGVIPQAADHPSREHTLLFLRTRLRRAARRWASPGERHHSPSGISSPEVQTELLLANLDAWRRAWLPVCGCLSLSTSVSGCCRSVARSDDSWRTRESRRHLQARPSRGRRHSGSSPRVEDALTRLSHGSLEKS